MAQLPEQLYDYLMKVEGGYVNNPHDHGGETKWGVTQNTLNAYYPNLTVQAMNLGQWKSIIQNYWKLAGCELILNTGVAVMVFDWFWGSGYNSTKRIQWHFKLIVDGVFGHKTAEIINNLPCANAIGILHDLRMQHFEEIVKSKPDQKIFLKGWLYRLEKVTQFAKSFNV